MFKNKKKIKKFFVYFFVYENVFKYLQIKKIFNNTKDMY